MKVISIVCANPNCDNVVTIYSHVRGYGHWERNRKFAAASHRKYCCDSCRDSMYVGRYSKEKQVIVEDG